MFSKDFNEKQKEALYNYEKRSLYSKYWVGRIKDGYSIKFCKSNDENIVISQLSGNKKLTKIGKYAFRDNKSINSITLPEGIREICEGAFENCENLSSIYLPESLMKIGKFAFFNCKNLLSITLSNNLEYIGDYAFLECEKLNINTYKNSFAEKYAKKNNMKISYLQL